MIRRSGSTGMTVAWRKTVAVMGSLVAKTRRNWRRGKLQRPSPGTAWRNLRGSALFGHLGVPVTGLVIGAQIDAFHIVARCPGDGLLMQRNQQHLFLGDPQRLFFKFQP